MTREECIKRLEYTKLRMKEATYSPETQEALDMAIRSLEAWSKFIEDLDFEILTTSEKDEWECENCLKHRKDDILHKYLKEVKSDDER